MRTADQVLSMRISEGAAGYGIYVMLLELLRDSETRSLVANPKNLAFAINEPDIALVERVVNDYGLFEVAPDGAFRSPWLESQMAEYDSKKEAAREAGRRGAAKRYGHKTEEEQQPNSNPIAPPTGSLKQPDSNKPNIILPNKEDKPNPKILALSYEGMSGQDLFSLSRTIGPAIGEEEFQWINDKQKELNAKYGANKYNLSAVLTTCLYYNLNVSMLHFLIQYTKWGEIGGTNMVKLMTLEAKNRADNFKPKFPAEYLLVKLLGA